MTDTIEAMARAIYRADFKATFEFPPREDEDARAREEEFWRRFIPHALAAYRASPNELSEEETLIMARVIANIGAESWNSISWNSREEAIRRVKAAYAALIARRKGG